MFVHSISETGRLLPSASRWNSIEIDFDLFPTSSRTNDPIPSKYSKSYTFKLGITDMSQLKHFIYASIALVLIVVALVLLMVLLPRKRGHHGSSSNLPVALEYSLLFFDAQKCEISFPTYLCIKRLFGLASAAASMLWK